MTSYFSVPTPAGLAELAAAAVDGQKVPFVQIAIGDGNGQPVDPTGRTQLVHEVDRVQVSSVRRHPAEPTWLIVEAALTEDRGGYWIRELALIGGRSGTVVMSVSNYAAVERPAPESGGTTAVVLRMVVAFADAAAVSLVVDQQAYATLQTVLDQIAIHEGKADPHPQYMNETRGDTRYRVAATTELKGIVELATNAETVTGTSAALAVTPAGVTAVLKGHTDNADPHPRYHLFKAILEFRDGGTVSLAAADAGKFVLLGGTSAGIVQLPVLSSVAEGARFVVKLETSAAWRISTATADGNAIAANGFSYSGLDFAKDEDVTFIKAAGQWRTTGTGVLRFSPRFSFRSLKAPNGFQELPNGYLEQWGAFTQQDTGDAVLYNWTPPIAFPNACVGATITAGDGISAEPISMTVEWLTPTVISGYTKAPVRQRIYRIRAIGY